MQYEQPGKKKLMDPIGIFDRDTVLHLRIPFSLYLLPIFCFGFSQAAYIHWFNFAIVFLVLHFFIYPGSNVYNSYMDRDTGSIGGLEKPPPVTPRLYYASLILDTAGIMLSLLIGWQFALIIMLYIAVSKAYSWHGIRLKKYPILSWIIVAIFQGGYTYMLVNTSITDNISLGWLDEKNLIAFGTASLLVGAFYPLTQVYQHEEDSRRGDRTISYILGVKGTFIFSAALFAAASVLMYFYFARFYSATQFYIFLGFLLPVVVYFAWWFLQVSTDADRASFANTMLINKISAPCMIACFCFLAWLNS